MRLGTPVELGRAIQGLVCMAASCSATVQVDSGDLTNGIQCAQFFLFQSFSDVNMTQLKGGLDFWSEY